MPVILENGSEQIQTWLDPKRSTWSKELQDLLQPYDGELEVYAVSKDVGKVGNNSPNFMVPIASTENKSNIANFFAKAKAKEKAEDPKFSTPVKSEHDLNIQERSEVKLKEESSAVANQSSIKQEGENRKTINHSSTEDNAPIPVPKDEPNSTNPSPQSSPPRGIKRELSPTSTDDTEEPSKKTKTFNTPSSSPHKASATPASASKLGPKTRSAVSNTASPSKAKTRTAVQEKGSQKITNFFGK